jgi:hypothetical protein
MLAPKVAAAPGPGQVRGVHVDMRDAARHRRDAGSLSGWLGRLADRPDEDLVDLHASRLVDRPEDGAGDVVGL